jgi:two-component system, NarL family, sensor histidine kinase UhpB
MSLALPREQMPVWAPGLLIFFLATIVALAPTFLPLPFPDSARKLSAATVSFNDGSERSVILPHSWSRNEAPAGPARAVYRIGFEMSDIPEADQYLLVRSVRLQATLRLNQGRLEPAAGALWVNPVSGSTPVMVVPRHYFLSGSNELEITLERFNGGAPGHLSLIYLGGEEEVGPMHRLLPILGDQLRATAYALQVLILFGILVVWTARPRDPIFGWMLALTVGTLAVAVAEISLSGTDDANVQPYLYMTLAAFGATAYGLALSILEEPRPTWLAPAAVLLPLALVMGGLLGVPAFPLALIGVLAAIAGHFGAAVALSGGFTRTGSWELGLLAFPFFLITTIGLRDTAVTLGLLEGGLLLSGYVRSLTILMIVILLMRRLATSLKQVDEANETLKVRLEQREAELAVLHERERYRAVAAVRDQERQRLMHDLHDGLSGHLVSIIALSEREATEPRSIEKAARAALEDLRLVINSLDIGDRDLPLALAGFRERLGPQLRRIGIELVWSMERLPEVSGVTPANALSILRILQEAVTNAIKHGPAGRIAIAASEGADGSAAIWVENDGRTTLGNGNGHGLANMKRRATQIGGTVTLDPTENGMRLTLTLPSTLTSRR